MNVKEARPHPLRQEIRDKLKELSKLCRNYEQTTHGSLGPFAIEHVGDALAECYRKPTAYTISELAQCIDGWLLENT